MVARPTKRCAGHPHFHQMSVAQLRAYRGPVHVARFAVLSRDGAREIPIDLQAPSWRQLLQLARGVNARWGRLRDVHYSLYFKTE